MIEKIISGGQTGADRAALDWAIENNVPHGGWCPKGRRAEDGLIDAKYQLKETPSSHYPQRTEWNVRDSYGTVIFSLAERLSGGSLKTLEFAVKQAASLLIAQPHSALELIAQNVVLSDQILLTPQQFLIDRAGDIGEHLLSIHVRLEQALEPRSTCRKLAAEWPV